MKEIPLTQDQVTLVDDERHGHLSQYRYHARWNPCTQSFYAQRGIRHPDGSCQTIQMSREIMSLEHGDPREIHHINGDTLDNRRSNLRVVTRLEHNHLHRDDPRKDASKYGVGIQRRKNGRFRARAAIAGKRHCVGTYDTPEEAQAARSEFLARLREEAA